MNAPAPRAAMTEGLVAKGEGVRWEFGDYSNGNGVAVVPIDLGHTVLFHRVDNRNVAVGRATNKHSFETIFGFWKAKAVQP